MIRIGVRSARRAAVGQNLSVACAPHRPEPDRRRHRLGVEIVHPVVRTDAGHVQDASRLGAAPVRVEVGVRQRLIESEQARVREDRFRVLRIVRTEQIGLTVGEQRSGRVQADDRVELSVLVLACVGCDVRTQAVPNQVDVVAGRTGCGHDRVDHARDDLPDGSHTVAGGNVVDRLRTCTPVDVHDVKLADADEMILDAPVQAGVLTLQEAVDQEARRMGRVEVTAGHRTSIVPADHLRMDRIATGVQPEHDVCGGIKQWLDLIVTLRHIVRVNVDQTQSPIAIRNEGPRRERSRRTGREREDSLGSGAEVGRLTAHRPAGTLHGTVTGKNLVVRAATHRRESTAHDRFGQELVGPTVRTSTGNVHATARLSTATVRVERGLSQRQIEAQQSGVRVDRFHVLRIVQRQAIVAVQREQGERRVHAEDRVQTTELEETGIASGVRSKTVACNADTGEGDARVGLQEVDERGHHVADGTDTCASERIVHSLCSNAPIDGENVKVSSIQPSILQDHVHLRETVIVPSVNDEARRMGRVKVRGRQRTGIAKLYDLRCITVAAGVEPEDRIGGSSEVRLRHGLVDVVRVQVGQM
uniref:Uncharacterized protein n=1 Tax=Anopheles epiroticus TaxID=199890 RepID=A0A182PC83_9DIPT